MKKENESLYKFVSRVQHLRTTLGLPQEMLTHEADVHGTYIGTVKRDETSMTLLNI